MARRRRSHLEYAHVQVAVLGCVGCLHGTAGAMLPRAVLVEADVFSCVLTQLSHTACSLHQQEPSLTAAHAAARVRDAADACLAAAARSSVVRATPVQKHMAPLLRASAAKDAAVQSESALLMMGHSNRCGFVTDAESMLDAASLRDKCCNLLQVRRQSDSIDRELTCVPADAHLIVVVAWHAYLARCSLCRAHINGCM